MQISQKSSKFGKIYTTDQFCPECEKQNEMTLLNYSLAGEILECRVCGYVSDWRPILDADVCTNFPHPNAPSQAETPKPVRFDSDTETLAEAALAAIPFPISYGDWLKCGFALASEFGARRAAELMYRHSPPTKPGETIEDYTRIFAKFDGRVGIGTLFAIAKQHGWNFPTTRPQGEPSALNGKSPTNELTKYPLERLNGHAPADESDLDDESELPEDENEDFSFDEDSLIQRDTVFERIYEYCLYSDVPLQFAFTGALATVAAVIGNRVKLEFGDQSLKVNDYYVLLAPSGGGKSTALTPVYSLLQRLEKKFIHDDTNTNLFLFPNSATERAIVDVMREASDAEREKGVKHIPQTSGLLIVDEMTSLFSEMSQKHSAKLDSIILKLWDGVEMTFATSKRLDGKFTVPESALTILGASTPAKFRSALPKTAFSDGLLARMNFIHCARRTKPRRPIGLMLTASPLNDASSVLIDELIELFRFVVRAPKIEVTADAIEADKANVERWFEEQNGISDNEAIDACYNRIAARCWKYALILSVCRAFQARENNIVIDGETLQHAARIADFFKKQFIFFVQRSDATDERGLDVVGRAKLRLVKLVEDKFGGQVKLKTLRDYSGLGKQVFETALGELLDAGRVKKEQRPNANNRSVYWIVIPPKNNKSRFFTSSLLHFKQINETETKLKIGSEEKKASEEHNVLEVQKAENPVPPQPTVIPEPTDELLTIACEIAKSVPAAEFRFSEFVNAAKLYRNLTEAQAKNALNLLLECRYIERTKFGFIRTQKLYDHTTKQGR